MDKETLRRTADFVMLDISDGLSIQTVSAEFSLPVRGDEGAFLFCGAQHAEARGDSAVRFGGEFTLTPYIPEAVKK